MKNDGKFIGVVQSEQINGEAIISPEEEALIINRAGLSISLTYAEIDLFYIKDYKMYIDVGSIKITLSQMGRDLESLYELLWNAYNTRTLKAFFVSGEPELETQGEYNYSDDGGQSSGIGKIKLFSNCLCILPPSSQARRVPLCFISELEIKNYAIRIVLDTGEAYEVIRLGSNTQRLYELIIKNMNIIHDNAVAAVKSIDSSLDSAQASSIARLMPDGAAASFIELGQIAESFISALEVRIAESRAAETYKYFKTICSSDGLFAGIKTGLSREEEGDAIWVAALKQKETSGTAAVELALGVESSAATYLYSFKSAKNDFFKRLNHAMEAISFHREVISMPEEELRRGENALYNMAVKRTGALRFLRGCYAGRAIHRSQEAWRQTIDEAMNKIN